jgi:hypothetical protein
LSTQINGVEEKEMESLDAALESESTTERKKGGSFDAHGFRKKRIEDFLIQTSGKMVLVDKLLPKLKAEGHKVSYPRRVVLTSTYILGCLLMMLDLRV